MKYLALLRGINVGGNNLVSMAELRRCLEGAGFKNVSTYIQSGNVLLESQARDLTRLTASIEALLSAQFGYTALVVLVSADQLKRVVREAPEGFGSQPDTYQYDVIFFRAPFRARDVLPTVKLKEGVDEAFAGDHAIYLRRLISKASQSQFSKLVSHPAYKGMTIRNWNTTSKLHKLSNQ